MRPQPSDGFAWVQAPGGEALVCLPLLGLARHLFTTRAWTLGFTRDADDAAAWDEVAGALSVSRAHLIRVHQVHGAAVVVCREGEQVAVDAAGSAAGDADIILSNDPGLALAIQTADCIPLLVADRRIGAVAAAHAGWRGLAAGVPMTTVEAMTREFGSRPADLVAAIGPSISAPAYEVGKDVWERFAAAGFSADQLARWFRGGARADHWHFDGWQATREQLDAAGIPADQVHLSALCTATDPAFCSYRRDGAGAGRVAAAIRAITPGSR
jgi:polyphenol oxidase